MSSSLSEKSSFRWRPGGVFWLICVGLILVNVAFFCSPDTLSNRSLRLVWYYLNYQQWPSWYSSCLWIIACGTVLNLFVTLTWRRKSDRFALGFLCPRLFSSIASRSVKGVIFYLAAIAVGLTSFFGWWPPTEFFRFCYYNIYSVYYLGPLSDYMYKGTFSWRTAVAPLTIVSLIILLAAYYRRLRRTKNGK